VLARDCLRETPPPRLAVVHASVGTRPIARRGVPPPRPAVSSGRVCRISAPRCRRRRARCPRLPTPLAITEPPAPVDYGCSIRGRHDCFGRNPAVRPTSSEGLLLLGSAAKSCLAASGRLLPFRFAPFPDIWRRYPAPRERTLCLSALPTETGGKRYFDPSLDALTKVKVSEPIDSHRAGAAVLNLRLEEQRRATATRRSPPSSRAGPSGCRREPLPGTNRGSSPHTAHRSPPGPPVGVRRPVPRGTASREPGEPGRADRARHLADGRQAAA
jgi:hypothetical protein